MVEPAGWTCPLTPLENNLRQLAGEQGHATGFIDHYLLPVVYPESWSVPVGPASMAGESWRRR